MNVYVWRYCHVPLSGQVHLVDVGYLFCFCNVWPVWRIWTSAIYNIIQALIEQNIL
jgi:hypothetical protein